MLSQKAFAIRDSKAQTYGTPWFKHNNELAIRDFHGLIKSPNSLYGMFPTDYALFEIGRYNIETGLLEPLEQPNHIVNAIDLKDKQ